MSVCRKEASMCSEVMTLDGKILEGWNRHLTENGIPYYISPSSEDLQWTHPVLVAAMEDLSDFHSVKYAAYRTALKLRSIQKITKLDQLPITLVIALLEQHRIYSGINQGSIECSELMALLNDLFFSAYREEPLLNQIELSVEITLNFFLNLYDQKRSGLVKILSIEVALLILCSGKLHEKFKYLFRQAADYNSCISKKQLRNILLELAQIPEFLSERLSFGRHLVPAAIDSCFSKHQEVLGITEDVFLDWIMREPQTLVWLSTLYRLTAAESVLHPVKCAVCKMYPVQGLRYQCLKCFRYDQCQNCFFTGQTNKHHKLKHPMQEYCCVASNKEDMKALMQVFKNKLKLNKMKQRYLPIEPSQSSAASDTSDAVSEENDDIATENNENIKLKVSRILQTDMEDENLLSKTIIGGSPMKKVWHQQRQELESIIGHLENENKQFTTELEKLRSSPHNTENSQILPTSKEKEEHLAQQVLLEDHTYQLETQLQRLRHIVKKYTVLNKTPPKQIIHPITNWLESTPAVPSKEKKFNLVSPINYISNVTGPETSNPSFLNPTLEHTSHNQKEDSPQRKVLGALENITLEKQKTKSQLGSSNISNSFQISVPNYSDTLLGMSTGSSKVRFPVSENSEVLLSIQKELEELLQQLETALPSDSNSKGYFPPGNEGQMLHAAYEAGNALAELVEDIRL